MYVVASWCDGSLVSWLGWLIDCVCFVLVLFLCFRWLCVSVCCFSCVFHPLMFDIVSFFRYIFLSLFIDVCIMYVGLFVCMCCVCFCVSVLRC